MKVLVILILLINTTDIYSQNNQQNRRPQQGQQNRRPQQGQQNRRPQQGQQNRRPQQGQQNRGPQQGRTARPNPNHQEILLDSNFKAWETYLRFPEQGEFRYSAIYYNPRSNKYFFASITEETNIQYKIDPFNNKEKVIIPELTEDSLFYVGNLTPLKRVIVNTNRNRIYVKTLTPIIDNKYRDNNALIESNLPPVFPMLNTIFQVQYTNTTGTLYNRVLSENGILQKVR